MKVFDTGQLCEYAVEIEKDDEAVVRTVRLQRDRQMIVAAFQNGIVKNPKQLSDENDEPFFIS